VLTSAQQEFLAQARRAVLGTTGPSGRPRLFPLAFAFAFAPAPRDASEGLVVYSALDGKPKSVTDPRQLARVRDIAARPRVSLLVDRWSEDWTELAWLRLDGVATLLEPTDSTAGEHRRAIVLLRERYPQYASHRLEERPILRIEIERVVGWGHDQ
jgi:PPOX class probable F420-dependent enzyme